MHTTKIGIVHPGQMGEFVGAILKRAGHQIYWVSENRSAETRNRAEKHCFLELQDMADLCKTCEIIISVCPPVFADSVAKKIHSQSFNGIFVEANAISPEHSIRISKLFRKKDTEFVDGGIIGNPSWERGSTSLYLAGAKAETVKKCFPESNLEVHSLGDVVGKASALKMCYASYTKGTTALLCGILALAQDHEVLKSLEYEWSKDGNTLAQSSKERAVRATAKAWRFTGEMKEIASTFAKSSLPDGFHLSAAEIFERLSNFKGNENPPDFPEVISALLKNKKNNLS